MNIWPVFLREMLIFQKRIGKPGLIVATLMSPILYLVTFGMGIGRSVSIEEGSYFLFIVPGICAMSAMTNSFSGIATSIAVGRLHYKSIDEVLVSPVSYLSVTVGEIAAGAVRGLFSSAFILIVAFFMGVSFPSDLLFYIAWILTTIMFASMGVFAGFRARSHEDTSMYSNFIIMPMSFFCGTFFPINNLPTGIAWFLQALPLTHSVACMRAGYQQLPVHPAHSIMIVFFCITGISIACIAIKQSLK